MAGKMSGPGGMKGMPPPPNQNFGTKSGMVDPDSIPANHPGVKSDNTPGMAKVGVGGK